MCILQSTSTDFLASNIELLKECWGFTLLQLGDMIWSGPQSQADLRVGVRVEVALGFRTGPEHGQPINQDVQASENGEGSRKSHCPVLFESVTSALFMMKPKPDKSSVLSEMPPGRPSTAESNRAMVLLWKKGVVKLGGVLSLAPFPAE